MRYLSIDIETTGLERDCYLIEFAAIPFDSIKKKIENDLSFHSYIECPPFEKLRPRLDHWVIEHNQKLIDKAAQSGISLDTFKQKFVTYLQSESIQNYFYKDKIFLFGKSLSALDLPILNRDLENSFMQKYFSHKVMDLSCFAMGLIDLGLLPADHHSSSALLQHFSLGEVPHTALEDATIMAQIYLRLLQSVKTSLL
ncbi:MAG: 3'-5' exoribonuclease [Oligoflexia bacterium]|nr:3'-5' exoribonuclease [Oligoflexia bacterium]